MLNETLGPDAVLAALKAAAEPTRLRILVLLANGELNVKDLTQILGQSQPRISRHLKLLNDAGLIERFKEGSWVYFHLADEAGADEAGKGRLLRFILQYVDRSDAQLERDLNRARAVKHERELAAQEYFRAHAAQWDAIRSRYIADDAVEAAMSQALGPGPFEFLIDLGTGTGRMLELFADRFTRGLGLDMNQAMLTYARGNLERAGLRHCHVRHGDLYSLVMNDGQADAVIMHQVLHFMAEPSLAIEEAARLLAPGGRLLIVDFAPHDVEALRDDFAHQRLGFGTVQMEQWLSDAGVATTTHVDLLPPDGGKKKQLTVSLWLGEKSNTPSQSVLPIKKQTDLEAAN